MPSQPMIAQPMIAQSTEFYVAGGTLPPDAPSYIVRAADEALYAGLQAGWFCYVLTSRQMGKSSLMHHTARRLKADGYAVVTLDLSKLGTNLTLEQWYYGLLRSIGQQLRMQPALTSHWERHPALSPLQRLFTALEEQVVPNIGPHGLILFVDEIDTVRRLPFSADEFFAAIRERHNARAGQTQAQGVAFCLLGVASPANLIVDPRTTPFNIGLRIELTDFTPAEAAVLLGGGLSRQQLARVLHWTGGHPYLTQRLCLDLVEQAHSGAPAAVDRRCAALFFGSRARQEETNLAFVQNTLLHLTDDVAALLELYRRIRRGERVPDDPTSPDVMLLCLSGLVRPQHRRLVSRNRIYDRVFDLGWIEASLPHAELRRQRAAYRRGALRTLAVSALILIVVGGLAWNAVLNARRAEVAAKLAAKNAHLYQAERDMAQRKTREAERAASEAREATKRAKDEALRRQAALAAANVARARERDARLKTLTLLSEAQADRGVQQLQHGDATGLLDLAASCRTVEMLPAARARRAALWSYWYSSCASELDQIIRQEKRINAMQFMPGGKKLVTGSADGTIRFWNCRTGEEEGRHLSPNGPVDLLAASPDGRYIAASTHDHGWSDEARVVLWDILAGRAIPLNLDQAQRTPGILNNERTIFQVAFTADSRQLVVVAAPGGNVGVAVWLFDAASGVLRSQSHSRGKIASVEFFSHDAGVMLEHIRDDSEWRVRLADTRDQHVLIERATEIASAVSGDVRLMATTSGWGDLRIVDWRDFDPNNNYGLIGHVMRPVIRQVAFQPGGELFAAVSEDEVKVFSLAKFRPNLPVDNLPAVFLLDRKYDLGQAAEPFQSIRFSPDGKSLAVQSLHAVNVYRLDKPEVIQRIVNYEGIDQIEFAPDSAALAVRTGNVARLWRLHSDTGQLRALRSATPVRGAVFSRDGRYAATIDAEATVRVWDTETGKPVSPPLHHSGGQQNQMRRLKSMGFTPDGTCLLVAGEEDWRLHCWDWRTGRERWRTPAHERDIRALAISPDGRRVATAAGLLADFCTVRQWDTRTGKLLGRYREPDIANEMAYSPDGRRLLMVGRAHTAAIHDAATGAPIGQPVRHEDEIESLDWSRDGRRVVTGSKDGTAQVWDACTGRPLGPPLRHRDPVTHVAYSPGDGQIATACLNGVVQLWDAATGLPLGAPMEHNNKTVTQLVFSPNGRLLFTGIDDFGFRGAVYLWDVPSGRPAGYRLSLMDGRDQISVSPDGRTLLGCLHSAETEATAADVPDGTALLWRIPDVPRLSPAEIQRRTEAMLGFRRNAQGFVEAMSPAEWRRLRAQIAVSQPHASR